MPQLTEYRRYAASFAPEVRLRLDEMRAVIARAIPQAAETISYGIPAFTIEGRKVVWFAAFKRHIGFYPGVAAIAAFEEELRGYKTAKGSIQFPHDAPIPRALVARMTKYAARARRKAAAAK